MKVWQRGFTLIELLVVLAIVAILLTISAPRFFNQVDDSKEIVLKTNLQSMRESIDQYYADQKKYPDSLEGLVERHYLRKIPLDPITESRDTWQIIAPETATEGGVYDVKSGAEGTAKDGTKYNDW